MDKTGGKYAIKKFAVDFNLDKREKIRASFDTEIELLKKLRHENIVRLIGYAKTEDSVIICMELLDCSLHEVLQQKLRVSSSGFSSVEATRMIKQITNGLCYLHRNSIAHRDVKVLFLLLLILVLPLLPFLLLLLLFFLLLL
jgi:serine/threonine protein kinase